MSLEHQDWNVVTLRKTNKEMQKQKERRGETVAEKKYSKPDSDVNLRKLDNDEEYKIPKMTLSVGKQIQEARLKKGMKQGDLAKACNIPMKIIQDYEKGIGLPQTNYLQTISRVLETKIVKPK